MGNKSNLGLSIRHLSRAFLLFSTARVSRRGAGPACRRIRLASSSPPPPRAASPPARSTRRPGPPTRIGACFPRARSGCLPSLSSSTRRGSCERCRSGGDDQGGATFTANKPVVYSLAPPLRTSGHTARWLVRAFETGLPETDSEYAAPAGRPFSRQSSSGCRFGLNTIRRIRCQQQHSK